MIKPERVRITRILLKIKYTLECSRIKVNLNICHCAALHFLFTSFLFTPFIHSFQYPCLCLGFERVQFEFKIEILGICCYSKNAIYFVFIAFQERVLTPRIDLVLVSLFRGIHFGRFCGSFCRMRNFRRQNHSAAHHIKCLD